MVFDVDENDVPHDLHVTTLPHIMLFKQGGADGIVTYSGKRLYETVCHSISSNIWSPQFRMVGGVSMLGSIHVGSSDVYFKWVADEDLAAGAFK